LEFYTLCLLPSKHLCLAYQASIGKDLLCIYFDTAFDVSKHNINGNMKIKSLSTNLHLHFRLK